ncbi:methionyl-tRNA formyltransferase [Trypanosoma theileri]|uniref:Methionyl-tRNA formyltransferase n=1 Tax=Trypanosoma theileri TaxID=67003 RepID=A0A1X0NUL9_9TRYP|nr:methionyl-tRNA formyltransferase [Trypanosoma theileri]ORC88238.1 methionyl-tRNA formyltransferase [Trypanosoma theileri]
MQYRILNNSSDVVVRRAILMKRVFILQCFSGYSRHCCSTTKNTGPCKNNSSGIDNSNQKESNVVKVPSIIFFGGDIVSLVALKALHEQLQAILSSSKTATTGTTSSSSSGSSNTVYTGKKQQLVVVCPFLPAAPDAISQRHHRQYPVARYCVEHNIPLVPVDHPTSLTRSGTLQYLLHPWHIAEQHNNGKSSVLEIGEEDQYIAGQPLEAFDVAVVVSFRYFLPNVLLERLPRTINVHPSLLPRYRGASPIFAPLLRNDTEGGVSVIKLPPHQRLMDSGDVLWQKSILIPREMTICEYFPLVTKLGGIGLCECLFGSSSTLNADAELNEEEVTTDIVKDVSSTTMCTWPHCFDAKWNSSWPQNYNVHYKQDPYHAPLLCKDRAMIKWHTMTSEEAYGTWRAFVGGEYYTPTVNAILDKGATPVKEQLLKRLLLRAARKIKKKICHHGQQNELSSQEKNEEEVNVLTSSISINSENDGSGTVEEMMFAVEDHSHLHRHLLISCAFTNAVHPKDIPNAVVRELELIDAGNDNLTSASISTKAMNTDHCCNVKSHVQPGSAYFPLAAEDMCAVKCREGWFVWQAVSLKGSSARLAALLRKGMAMKTGVLYISLFVDDNEEKEEKDGVTTTVKK